MPLEAPPEQEDVDFNVNDEELEKEEVSNTKKKKIKESVFVEEKEPDGTNKMIKNWESVRTSNPGGQVQVTSVP